MKKITLYILICFLMALTSTEAQAQVPQAFSYQGMAVDVNGDALENTTIGLKFSIIQNDMTGPVLYSDSHTTTTSGIGHFAANVGMGTIESGLFSDIDWSTGAYFLEVEMDETGGSNYSFTNTVELLSVPYAAVAENAANNPTGETGPIGDTGPEGPAGPQGMDGPEGPAGDYIAGAQGQQGAPGATGATGPAGEPGEPGGEQGEMGEMGDQGPKGPTQGDQGPEGAVGEIGETGDTGDAGPQGLPGPTGPASTNVGPIGPPGPPGPAGGPQGFTGPIGPPGADGVSGPQGLSGAAGPDYPDSISMSSTVPTPSADLNIYLDDGTNRADGVPGMRYHDGSIWIDL